MNILFGTPRVKLLCKSESEATKELGKKGMRRLGRQLELIERAPGIHHLREHHRFHRLTKNWAGHYSLDITRKMRLIFRIVPPEEVMRRKKLSRPPAGTTVEIAEIGDTHE